ncbi:MAG: SDR family NAD(P)-dependent oxidoreductase, partial [Actinomycetota bacterium]|nr:SDR family NAD(P)-dependent oxidoreductase [Actinomycetota bacterium]
AVRRSHEHFGGLDIVVNNAGYGQFGMVEELSEPEARDQIETNLFGALWVTQAEALDAYRPQHEAAEQRRGGNTQGDPTASAEGVMRIVDADEPPLRAFFGSAPLRIAESDYESRLATWREWQPVAELAQG